MKSLSLICVWYLTVVVKGWKIVFLHPLYTFLFNLISNNQPQLCSTLSNLVDLILTAQQSLIPQEPEEKMAIVGTPPGPDKAPPPRAVQSLASDFDPPAEGHWHQRQASLVHWNLPRPPRSLAWRLECMSPLRYIQYSCMLDTLRDRNWWWCAPYGYGLGVYL